MLQKLKIPLILLILQTTGSSCAHELKQLDNIYCVLDLKSSDSSSKCKGAGPTYKVLNEVMDGWIVMPPESHKKLILDYKRLQLNQTIQNKYFD